MVSGRWKSADSLGRERGCQAVNVNYSIPPPEPTRGWPTFRSFDPHLHLVAVASVREISASDLPLVRLSAKMSSALCGFVVQMVRHWPLLCSQCVPCTVLSACWRYIFAFISCQLNDTWRPIFDAKRAATLVSKLLFFRLALEFCWKDHLPFSWAQSSGIRTLGLYPRVDMGDSNEMVQSGLLLLLSRNAHQPSCCWWWCGGHQSLPFLSVVIDWNFSQKQRLLDLQQISVSGDYIPSSFGSSIEALVHMYGPIRDIPTAKLIDLVSTQHPDAKNGPFALKPGLSPRENRTWTFSEKKNESSAIPKFRLVVAKMVGAHIWVAPITNGFLTLKFRFAQGFFLSLAKLTQKRIIWRVTDNILVEIFSPCFLLQKEMRRDEQSEPTFSWFLLNDRNLCCASLGRE